MSAGWIAVDLDGTLAHYGDWISITHIGKPIAPMVDRVKAWLAEGKDVRIFTARVGGPIGREEADVVVASIEDWCVEHIGQALPITCKKNFGMVALYDDRCVQVIPNTGALADGSLTDRAAIVAAIHRAYPAPQLADQYDPKKGLTHARNIEFLRGGKRYDDDGECNIEIYDHDQRCENLRGNCVRIEFDDAGNLTRIYAG